MMPHLPVAFLSYVHALDVDGTVTAFRQRLERELRIVTGMEVTVFQDNRDIGWGEAWRERLERSIDGSTFFLPLLTPGYFRSAPCRDEALRFLEMERRLGRTDRVLPVYYVDTPLLNHEQRWSQDELAAVFASRQWIDWRELRTEALDSAGARRAMERLALAFRDALDRVAAPPPAPAPALTPPPSPAPARKSTPSGAPAPASARPTLRVDPRGRGDHRTIAAALAAAPEGATVVVAPGTYRESLVIERAVELMGEGAREDVVIAAGMDAPVTWLAPSGRLANLSIRGDAMLEVACVRIRAGDPEMNGCDISGGCGACVSVAEGAGPRIIGNQIHDCAGPGLLFVGTGGLVMDNHIRRTEPGVSIYAGADPVVRRNRIEYNRLCGIAVSAEGIGRFEGNDLEGNDEYGVHVESAAGPVFVENRINGHMNAGIHVTAGGSGTFRHNRLTRNGAPQLFVHPDARRAVQLAGNTEER